MSPLSVESLPTSDQSGSGGTSGTVKRRGISDPTLRVRERASGAPERVARMEIERRGETATPLAIREQRLRTQIAASRAESDAALRRLEERSPLRRRANPRVAGVAGLAVAIAGMFAPVPSPQAPVGTDFATSVPAVIPRRFLPGSRIREGTGRELTREEKDVLRLAGIDPDQLMLDNTGVLVNRWTADVVHDRAAIARIQARAIEAARQREDELQAQALRQEAARKIREGDKASTGKCDCPGQLDSAGRNCGGRCANYRPGGKSPTCLDDPIVLTDQVGGEIADLARRANRGLRID